MILYRLVRSVYADDLSGNGARLYGGRWNSEGKAMVYLASSRSLAVLEALAHLNPTNMPDDYSMITIEAPDSINELNLNILPENWKEYPEQNILQLVGNRFLFKNEKLLLKVPSALVEEEFNYLMNPIHNLAPSVKIVTKKPFSFDERLL
ncbi:MAG: RES family NAD+ phosphorylase [Mucilaginibacter sp.]|nr:RES family NAD+ phosphorylase [Mucilaginibacter sp.]